MSDPKPLAEAAEELLAGYFRRADGVIEVEWRLIEALRLSLSTPPAVGAEMVERAANRLESWLRYGNPRPSLISDEGRQFGNDLQLVLSAIYPPTPAGDWESAYAEWADHQSGDFRLESMFAFKAGFTAAIAGSPSLGEDHGS